MFNQVRIGLIPFLGTVLLTCGINVEIFRALLLFQFPASEAPFDGCDQSRRIFVVPWDISALGICLSPDRTLRHPECTCWSDQHRWPGCEDAATQGYIL